MFAVLKEPLLNLAYGLFVGLTLMGTGILFLKIGTSHGESVAAQLHDLLLVICIVFGSLIIVLRTATAIVTMPYRIILDKPPGFSQLWRYTLQNALAHIVLGLAICILLALVTFGMEKFAIPLASHTSARTIVQYSADTILGVGLLAAMFEFFRGQAAAR